MDTLWLIWIVAAYLCGSVPFGLLIGLAKGVDIREAGSGNVGATNAGRVLGRKWGMLCFGLDVAKGAAPVLVAGFALGYIGHADLPAADAWRWLAVAAAPVVGHVFPVWLKFKGGKGVATGLGVLLGMYPLLTLPALGALVVWIALAAAFRYVSVASMGAAVALPVIAVVTAYTADRTRALLPVLVVTGAIALLVLLRHRSNITRLLSGTESRIGEREG